MLRCLPRKTGSSLRARTDCWDYASSLDPSPPRHRASNRSHRWPRRGSAIASPGRFQAWAKDLVDTFPKCRLIMTSETSCHIDSRGTFRDRYIVEHRSRVCCIPPTIDGTEPDHCIHRPITSLMQTRERVPSAESTIVWSDAEDLRRNVRVTRALHLLATNPLLCAMSCAVHLHRFQHPPIQTGSKYPRCMRSRCCWSIRESKRRINARDYPALALRQHEFILSDSRLLVA